MSSRTVSLTSTFLLLAAGGIAACDNDEYVDERFYCATADGTVIDEDYCDENDHSGIIIVNGVPYSGERRIYRSSTYPASLTHGSKLPPGGQSFPYTDRASREKFGLPGSGRITNGTVKTGVVGKGGVTNGNAGSGAKSGG